MFANVRWRIALWFIGLSTAVYLVPTILAVIVFNTNLTAAIDAELNSFMASFGHAIKVSDGKPVLRDWARVVQTTPARSFISYQLFDRNGVLLEEHFPPGIPILFKSEHEVSSKGLTMRTRMTPIKDGDELVGYLQVQLPTKARDEAVNQLELITAVAAPLVLLGLGWSSYLVSEKATAQTRQTLAMFRQFVADASHELYTPLSIVQAANETLAQLVVTGGVGAAEFEVSENALERMEKMLEDLMLLSTMESPEASTSKSVVDISALIQDIVAEFRPKFDQKGIAFSYRSEEMIKTWGDHDALQRLFVNLTENAWRYTEPQGRVDIQILKDGHHVRVAVSDTGIGIPKENLPKIFDRFYRVDASRSRASGGSGLGLSIAQAIAHAHGGVIEVESNPGKGSVFRVTLPAVQTT